MHKSFTVLGLVVVLLVNSMGCRAVATRNFDLETHLDPTVRIPNEEVKTALPRYVVEPPDVLLIDALRVVPKSPYLL